MTRVSFAAALIATVFALAPAAVAVDVPCTYIVKEGDSLSSISARYNLSLASVEAANPQVVMPATDRFVFVGSEALTLSSLALVSDCSS
jgi:hypothetical protein